jgi:catalase (peroxidase I)
MELEYIYSTLDLILFCCCLFSFIYIRWHDAGTYDVKTKTGGPNGSIRFEEEYSHGSNAGLKIAIDLLGMLWT